MEALKRDVEGYPDAYQFERAKRLGVSRQGIWYALKRLGVSYKKTLRHPKANEEERRTFQETIKTYQEQKRVIVYLDESGFAHDMPRTHGYASVGERCYGLRDWHAKGRTNVIGALIEKALLTVGLFQTHINAHIFHAWLIQELLPTLPPNCVIVMDNATFHKRQDIKNAIINTGHTLEYLPSYSPDLNDIEHKWSQAKATRRRESCSITELFRAYAL